MKRRLLTKIEILNFVNSIFYLNYNIVFSNIQVFFYERLKKQHKLLKNVRFIVLCLKKV